MALSEQEILTRLFELENSEQADRRARLTGDRYLALFLGKVRGRSQVFLHGLDNDDGFSTADAEFTEFETAEQAEATYDQMLAEYRGSGELVEEDSVDDLGDATTSGADPEDMKGLTDNTDDPLVVSEP